MWASRRSPETLGKTEAACRQLVSRARKRVRSAAPRFDAPPEETADLLARFAAAAASGDQQAVLRLLAPEAVAVSDGGGKARAALRVLYGAAEIALVMTSISVKQARRDPSPVVRLVIANGAPALAVMDGGEDDMLLTILPDHEGRVGWIYIMRNPEKLPTARSTPAA